MGFTFCLMSACAQAAIKPAVVAYVFPQNHIIQPGEIAVQKLTRINYAFANIKDNKIIEGFPTDVQNFAALEALKKENPSLTVLVSVGGWLWSGNFSDMALTKKSRAAFIQSVTAFLERYHLDGLDVDWEYPGLPGATNRFRPEDKQNYTLLLKELHERFSAEEKMLHRRLYLTIAAGAQSEFLAHTEMGEVQKYVDSVNLMAYDYYEPGSDTITGNHAPLFINPADPKKVSADRSVHEFEAAGVPATKIVLGVPFYGHVWKNVPYVNHGLFQAGEIAPNAFDGYADIAVHMQDHGFTRYWDKAASVPYLYNPESRIFISYEDPESLAAKCRYVRKHKLAGIMFWQYTSDPSGKLLDTIDTQLGIPTQEKAGAR
jgi:chitinase